MTERDLFAAKGVPYDADAYDTGTGYTPTEVSLTQQVVAASITDTLCDASRSATTAAAGVSRLEVVDPDA